MRLAGVLVRRLAMLPLVLLGVVLVTFFISRVAPGDPAQLVAGPRATPEAVAEIRERLNLDAPLPEQFTAYVGALARGDLGQSIMSDRPVAEEIFSYMPATLELMLCAFVLTVLVGVPLGVLTALYRDRLPDIGGRVVAIAGISIPTFWLGLLLLLLFYSVLGIAPGAGRLDSSVVAPPNQTGLYVIDSLLVWDWTALSSALRHLALPALTLAAASVGVVVRLVRGSMIEVLTQDYVRTARAFGLPKRQIILQYALPNALVPFVTVLGLELSSLLFGSVVIESVFGWPGLGSFVLAAILNLDFPVIMGFAVIASFAFVAANLLVDLLYMALDPRVRGLA